MENLSAIARPMLFAALISSSVLAQGQPAWNVPSLNQVFPGAPEGSLMTTSTTATGTNGTFVQYGNATLMADSVSVDFQTRSNGTFPTV